VVWFASLGHGSFFCGKFPKEKNNLSPLLFWKAFLTPQADGPIYLFSLTPFCATMNIIGVDKVRYSIFVMIFDVLPYPLYPDITYSLG